jgi:glutamine synthetase
MIKDEDAAYVDIRFTDPRGKLQHVTVMSDLVDEDFLDEGFMFDGSSIAGWKGIEASDMKLMPDTESAYVDPFYAEKTICCTAPWSSPTPASPTSATRAAPRFWPRPISSPPASATWPISAPRRNSSSSTTCGSPTR